MPGWESGEVTGTVSEVTDDYVQVSIEGKNYPKKIWRGNQYEGDLPPLGFYGVFAFDTSPPKQGRKFGSSYITAYQKATPPSNGSQNGSQTPSDAPRAAEGQVFVGREPGTADKLQAARWAISTGAEVLGPGRANLSEYVAAGAVLYAGMFDVVEKYEPREATKSESEEDAF